MAKKHSAPPGLDYDPITGDNPNISYGTVLADAGKDKARRTLTDVIFRRFYPTERPDDPQTPWVNPTADRWEVLLPRGAPDALADPHYLAQAYHHGAGDKIQHLATIVSLRFPEADALPMPGLRLHEAWFLATGFGRRLAAAFEVAAVAVMHVPGRSWGLGHPHVHLILPCRRIQPATQFSTFVKPLIEPEEGRAYVDQAWRAWREEAGYGE